MTVVITNDKNTKVDPALDPPDLTPADDDYIWTAAQTILVTIVDCRPKIDAFALIPNTQIGQTNVYKLWSDSFGEAVDYTTNCASYLMDLTTVE